MARAKTKKKAGKTGAARAVSRGVRAKAAVAAKPKAAPAAKAKAAKPKAALAAKPKAVPAAKPKAARGAARVGAGARMPAFSLPDQTGAVVSSASLSGSPYVLYFYPKDDTPGCTREACGFRDELSRFEKLGVRVIGVSPDKPESHTKFRAKYSLPFTLLADTEKTLANALGVWVKKQNYGREYMGIERSTFLVDGRGTITKAWHGVKVDGHVGKVLEAASSG